MKTRILLSLSACVLLAACATAPKPLQGTYTQVTPRDAVAGAQVGASVRWGGSIVDTKPGQDQTCFQLLSRPLNATGRPANGAPDATDGRFIACRAGFYDPAVFAPGRDVTFIGKIEGYETTKIGDYDYKLPKVAADVVYLWPEQREVQVNPYPYYPYDPFWGPRWGWGGWGWRRW
jgi:outer membrane lipoprotein